MVGNREASFDLIRATAIVLIVLTHSTSILGFDVSSSLLNRIMYSKSAFYGLGLFTMLSGALQMRSRYDFLTYYRKRFIRILVPFALWATFVYVISSILGKYDNVHSLTDALVNYFPALLLNRINVAYWYVYLIILLYALTPFFIKIFRRNDRASFFALTTVLLVWLIIETFLSVEGNAGMVIFYMGLYLLGWFLDKVVKRTRLSAILGISGFVILFAIDCLYVSNFMRLLSLVSLYVGLSGIQFDNSVIFDLSRYSYTVYLTHFIFIRFLFTLIPGFFSRNIIMPILMMTIVVIIEYYFCKFLEKCKFVPNSIVGF